MRKLSLRFALVTLLIFITVLIAHADHPSDGPPESWFNTIISADHDFEVHYVPTDSCDLSDGVDPQCFYFTYPTAKAIDSSIALDDSRTIYNTFEFPDDGDRDVWFYDCNPWFNCDNGFATTQAIFMPTPIYAGASESCTRMVLLHELFHHVQMAYTGAGAGWPIVREGHARLVQDKLFADLDDNPAANCGFGSYLGSVDIYLSQPGISLWAFTYSSALWWNYVSEKYSPAFALEPHNGLPFIRRWWEIGQNDFSIGPMAITEETIQEHTPAATLEGVFLNFAITNIAKDFFPSSSLSPNIQNLFWYIDDINERNYQPIDIPAVQQGVISIGNPYQPTRSVAPWGAAYFEANVDQCPTGSVIYVKTPNVGPYVPPYGPTQSVGLGMIGVSNNTVRVIKRKELPFIGYSMSVTQPFPADYDRIFAIVTGRPVYYGGVQLPQVTLRFSCGFPILSLIPDSLQFPSNPWAVDLDGEEQDLNRIAQVDVEVTVDEDLGRSVLRGLEPEQFEVYIGDATDPANEAEVLQAAQIEESYRLTLRVPAKNAGHYPVTIRVGASEVSDPQGVRYLDSYAFDRILLIDQTSSMGEPEESPSLEAVKAAAKFFVDNRSDRGQMGLIGFAAESDQQSDISLNYVQLQSRMQQDAFDRLEPSTGAIAPLGNALSLAIDAFNDDGQADALRQIVLVSDSVEPAATGALISWDDVREDVVAAGIQIHTIALGPGSDQALLQEIALATGGQYHYVKVDSPDSQPLITRLADAYGYVADVMEGRGRVWEENGDDAQLSNLDLQSALQSARISLLWTPAAVAPDVELLRPDGSEVRDRDAGVTVSRGDNHVVYKIETAEAGGWQLNVDGVTEGTQFFAAASGRLFDVRNYVQPVQFYFGQNHADAALTAQRGRFARGAPVLVRLGLVQDGIIANGNVLASVEHPDGVRQRLLLYDDGDMSDVLAQDGIYTGLYPRTTAASPAPFREGDEVRGSYNVRVELEVGDQNGATQEMIAKGSFVAVEHEDETRDDVDRDRDGLPNRYEELERCLDPQTDDAAADPDEDGLSSENEYRTGTSPCRSDTDGGGEHDGSEHARGGDPLDHHDDALRQPSFAMVEVRPSEHEEVDPANQLLPLTNLIRYSINRNYDQIVLERSLAAEGPFQVIARFSARQSAGLFRDGDLLDGQEYFYRLKGVDAAGNESAYSPVFSGTAKEDPIPPHGSVSVKGGTPRTDSANVVLLLDVLNDDPADTEMQIANNARFEGASWQPFQPEIDWALDITSNIDRPAQSSNRSTVFVKFRDPAHNESYTYSLTFVVEPPDSLGAIRGAISLEGGVEPIGVAILPIDNPTIPSTITDDTGQFTLENLPAGNYTLLFEHSAYASQSLEVELLPGATLDVGTVMLNRHKAFFPILVRAN